VLFPTERHRVNTVADTRTLTERSDEQPSSRFATSSATERPSRTHVCTV